MLPLSGGSIIIIALVALLIFGPKKNYQSLVKQRVARCVNLKMPLKD